jgi:glycosyltransferase involved in cell wall biosynthesis
MLNVLTFSTLYPNAKQPNFGGFVERQTQRLAARNGVDLRVVAPVGRFPLPVGPYGELRFLADVEDRAGLEVHYPQFNLVPMLGWRLNPTLVERAARLAMSRLERDGFRPDVIDCEFFWPDGPAAVAIGRALGIPVSIKARGSDIRFWGARAPAARRMVAAADAADGLLAVSEALKDDMVALGMPAERIRVHYTGVELDAFVPVDRAEVKRSLGIDGPLLVAAGNLVPLKRVHLVIDALRQLPEATLIVVGEGSERQRLVVRAANAGVGNRVRFLGKRPHGELPRLIGAADVFVHASSSEGLANVWIEALACGTPVVTTKVGGASEVIDRPAAGRLLDSPAPAAIAAAVSEVISCSYAPAAVREAALRFGWEQNTEVLYTHLCRLTGREPAPLTLA